MKVRSISICLAILLSISCILSCQNTSTNKQIAGSSDSLSLAEEAITDSSSYYLLVATLIDSMWVFEELKGILIVALEDKLNMAYSKIPPDSFSIEQVFISPSAHYSGISDTITYYLEGRSKGVYNSAVVALELMIEDGVNLIVNPNGQIHSCIPSDSGLCIFVTKFGNIVGCDCVHKDTSRVCDYITSKDVILPI